MPTTSRGYPYPTSGDDVDVPGDLLALATAINTDVGNVVGSASAAIVNATAVFEGTQVKATGVASNYVLTGNGSGGAHWQPGGGDVGEFSSSTVTYSFGTPNDFSQTYTNTQFPSNSSTYGIGGGGSVILVGAQQSSNANSKYWNTFNFATTRTANTAATAFATAQISPSPAGTIQSSGIFGLDAQEAASTAVYWTEKWLVSAGATAYASIRKYNTALSTAIWNAVVFGPSNVTNFTSLNNTYLSAKYAATPNAWYGVLWDQVSNNSTAVVWAVNDTSGSVFKANFGLNGSGTAWEILDVAYIPPVTGDGTVWAVGYNASATATVRRVAYTLNSGALTAASTADNWNPIGTTVNFSGLYWDSVATAIVWRSTDTYYGLDRTFSTNTFTSTSSGNVRAQVRYGDYGFGIRSINSTSDNGRVGVFGTAGTFYAPAPVNPSGSVIRPIRVGGTLVGFLEGHEGVGAPSYLISRLRNDQEVLIPSQAYGRFISEQAASQTITINRTIADDRIAFATGMTYLPAGGSVVQGATSSTAAGNVTRVIREIQLK